MCSFVIGGVVGVPDTPVCHEFDSNTSFGHQVDWIIPNWDRFFEGSLSFSGKISCWGGGERKLSLSQFFFTPQINKYRCLGCHRVHIFRVLFFIIFLFQTILIFCFYLNIRYSMRPLMIYYRWRWIKCRNSLNLLWTLQFAIMQI